MIGSVDVEFLFRQGLIGLSICACGLLVYLAQGRIGAWWRNRDGEELAHAMLDVGTAMVIFAIVQSILLKIPRIPVTWQGLLYFGGLALIVFGAIGVAVAARSRSRNQRRKEAS